jgi:hypothetical protein
MDRPKEESTSEQSGKRSWNKIRLSQTKTAFSFWREASNGQKSPKIISNEILLKPID